MTEKIGERLGTLTAFNKNGPSKSVVLLKTYAHVVGPQKVDPMDTTRNYFQALRSGKYKALTITIKIP